MKKFVYLALALVVAFSIVGCNNSTPNVTGPSDTLPHTTDKSDTTPNITSSTTPNITPNITSNTTNIPDDQEYFRTGFYDGMLYLNMDGNVLIYDKRSPGIGSLTRKTVLGGFYTSTAIEGIIWYVYSTEEYPDLSHVLVISGTNASWTYMISDGEE